MPNPPPTNAPVKKRRHMALTPQRIEAFIAAYAEHGNFADASKAASPLSDSPDGALTSFRRLEQTDKAFAERLAAAKELSDHALLKEARRRAIEGIKEPLVKDGQIVGFKHKYSDRLLVKLLEGAFPRLFRAKMITHDGVVQHQHVSTTDEPKDSIRLDRDDLLILSAAERQQLRRILETVEANKGRQIADMPLLESSPVEPDAVDAEFEDASESEKKKRIDEEMRAWRIMEGIPDEQ